MFETILIVLAVYLVGAAITSFVIGKVEPTIGDLQGEPDYGRVFCLSAVWPITAGVVAPFYFASRKKR